MDYSLSDEQKQIVEAARKFARNEFPKVARECDREEKFPREVWEQAGELGFMGIFIAPEYGGLGLGCLEHAMVMEEFWRVDPGVGNILLAVFGAEILGAFGTPDQKQKYLSHVSAGRAIMGCAITEPNAGSDIFGVKTRAVKTGGGYVINGTKQFITNGSLAHFLLVFCLTNPELRQAYLEKLRDAMRQSPDLQIPSYESSLPKGQEKASELQGSPGFQTPFYKGSLPGGQLPGSQER